jgi:DNA end-binding protein Ku
VASINAFDDNGMPHRAVANSRPRKVASGQKEMLMPIAGKKPVKDAAAKKPAAKLQRRSA